MKIKNKKNPFMGIASKKEPKYKWVEEIFKEINIPYIFLAKSQISDVYFLDIKESITLFSATQDLTPFKLIKGEYVYKVYYNNYELTNDSIKYLLLLSKNLLIPHIFYIDTKIIVMKYIEGLDLLTIIQNKIPIPNNICTKIEKELNNWHQLGFFHGDLSLRNILLHKSQSSEYFVILIDPIEGKRIASKLDDLKKLQNIKTYLKEVNVCK